MNSKETRRVIKKLGICWKSFNDPLNRSLLHNFREEINLFGAFEINKIKDLDSGEKRSKLLLIL